MRARGSHGNASRVTLEGSRGPASLRDEGLAGLTKEMEMSGRIPVRLGRLAAAALACGAVLGGGAAAASAETEVVYDNLPEANPGNVVSEAFEATQTGQFGGLVKLAGTHRSAGTVTVGMSSWGCQHGGWTGSPECITENGAKFSMPITLNISAVEPGGAVGPLLKSVTKTFNIPYRPSQNNRKCTGTASGAWYNGRLKECFHGKYVKITFAVGRFTWPSEAIVSVAYNTSDYGAHPQRPQPCNSESGGCGYDSLNVGLTEPPEEEHPTAVAPSIGSDPLAESAYQDTKYAPYFCDKGAGGTGVFRLDQGCWTGYQPLIEVKAS